MVDNALNLMSVGVMDGREIHVSEVSQSQSTAVCKNLLSHMLM